MKVVSLAEIGRHRGSQLPSLNKRGRSEISSECEQVEGVSYVVLVIELPVLAGTDADQLSLVHLRRDEVIDGLGPIAVLRRLWCTDARCADVDEHVAVQPNGRPSEPLNGNPDSWSSRHDS